MKNILHADSRAVLSAMAAEDVLLGFDYDGTLAPIVDEPSNARMRDRTRRLLEQVAGRYPCVVISGRAQEDVARRLRGTGIREVIGNHGLEPWRRTEPFAADVDGWATTLRRRLAGVEGVFVEDKLFSLAIHYRLSPYPDEARRRIEEAVAGLSGIRSIGGKKVVNVLPAGAPDKGAALEAARMELKCQAALYLGDDQTDEDVFGLAGASRLLSIRVGESPASRAAFYVPDQWAVDTLLERLLALRAHPPRGSAA